MTMMRRMMAGLIAVGAGLGLFALPATAQDSFPDRPIHAVIGFPAGSGADILGRYFAHALEVLAKQPVVVDNKPGATSNIAVRAVAEAKPDGYTILFVANSNMAGSRYLFKDLPFDTLKDFVPIASFAQITFVMVVGPNSPMNTLQDMTNHLKAKKESLYGYTNQTAQLASEYYKQLAGVDVKPVAYKSAGDTLRDLSDGTLDFVIMDGTFAAGQIQQGALKAIAVTTKERFPNWPNTPTIEQAGLANYDFAPWWGAYLPKGTPQPIVDKLQGLLLQIDNMKETADFLLTVGAFPTHDDSKMADARLKAELPKWEKLVKAAGIEPQ